MSIIRDKAAEIAHDMGSNLSIKSTAIDPFTISIVVNVLVELVKLYMECKKTPQQTSISMRNPNFVERWRLRRVIKHHVNDDEAHNLLGGSLFYSTLKVSSKVTEEEVKSMFQEVESEA